jgi:hypothetical protein
MSFAHGFDTPLSRRNLVGGAAMAGAGVGFAAAMGAMPGLVPEAQAAWQPNYDDPEDNLKALVKLTSDLSGKPIVGWYGGHVFAVVGDEILKPLFGLEGFGTGMSVQQPDGTFKSSWKEVGFYKDLVTGKIIENWNNPYINEKVEVVHIQNEAVNTILAPNYPDYTKMALLGEAGQLKMEFPNYTRPNDLTRPMVLPWTVVGDQVAVWNDFRGRVKNVLDPKEYVRESTGEYIRVSEFFLNMGSHKLMMDEGVANVPATGAWNRLAPWLPWMFMGRAPGHLFYRCTTKKLNKFEELPKHILDYTEKKFNAYLNYDTPWRMPNESSWEVYTKLKKPAPVKAGT